MEKSLKLYKIVNNEAVPFPSANDQIEIASFKVELQRMGAAPFITATVLYPTCLDGQFDDVFVTFNSEKYYVKDEMGSSKTNDKKNYSHELKLVSQRAILDEVYMIDAVVEDSEVDGYKSNDTKIQFMGDIHQWAARLNDAFAYSGVTDIETGDAYEAVVDSGVSSEDKLVAFEDKFLSEALQEGFNIFQIPYYFIGTTLHFGEASEPITQICEYGRDAQLLSIGKTNAGIKQANRMSGYGSKDNLPYYYPNPTPLGFVELDVDSSASISIRSMERLRQFAGRFPLTYEVREVVSIGVQTVEGSFTGNNGSIDIDFNKRFTLTEPTFVKMTAGSTGNWKIWFRDAKNEPISIFTVYGEKHPTLRNVSVVANKIGGGSYDITNGAGLPEGEYYVTVEADFSVGGSVPSGQLFFDTEITTKRYDGVWVGNNGTIISDAGLSVVGFPEIDDTVGLNVIHYIEPTGRLMPPIYRDTYGEQRFYNAVNNTYPKAGGGYYTFPNPYTANNRRELIKEFDEKPTIVGLRNYGGQRMDMFSAFAWDADDNDDFDEEGNYVHPFFFAKLRQTNGTYGFNLFDCATESDMQVSFTSGVCGGCKFDIAVNDETKKNSVRVDSSGNLLRDAYGNVECGRSGQSVVYQDEQNDTSNNEVWIALRKDNTTYPAIMPSTVRNLTPSTSDTFVLLNIWLPQAFILAAEARLKTDILDYMLTVNDTLYNPSVAFSRIFLEENPTFLAQLNENSRIQVMYNDVVQTYYITRMNYTMQEGAILPDISVELILELQASGSSLAAILDIVRQQFAQQSVQSSIAGMFLRKDIEDTALQKINFLKGVNFGRYTAGLLGSGGTVSIDAEGNSRAEFDFLQVRKSATFTELVIDRERAITGNFVISPAGVVVLSVEDNGSYYRCYFEKNDNKGNIIVNPFMVNDLVRAQSFNLADNRYYWRKVVAVGADYVDLSNSGEGTGYAAGSEAPRAGDNLVLIGNTTDTQRQSAITIASYGTNTPSIRMYHGIGQVSPDSEQSPFSLVDKDIFGVEYDDTLGFPRMFNYGSMRLGARENDAGGYIEYDHLTKELNISAIVHFLAGSTGLEETEAYQQLVAIANGNIQTWFYDDITPPQEGEPTLSNYPASAWTTETEREIHIGDLYYSDEGKAFRFKKNTQGVYSWLENVDTDVALALQTAREAKDAADNAQDDVDGLNDDVSDFKTYVDGAFKDGVIDQTEKERIDAYKKQIATSKAQTDNSYNKVHDNPYLPAGTVKTALESAKTNFNGKYTDLIDAIDAAVDGTGSIDDVNTAYDNYNTAYGAYVAALGDADKAIEDAVKNGAITAINDAYKYLKEALDGETITAGGLVLTSLIALGYKVAGEFQIMSGINGTVPASTGTHSIAAWFGGDMEDRYRYDSSSGGYVKKSSSQLVRPANSLFRFDGSGYLAMGSINWDENGLLQIENGCKVGAFTIDENGLYNEIKDGTSIPDAYIELEKSGGRFFRVNVDRDKMLAVRGDGIAAIHTQAYGNNSTAIYAIAQGAGSNMKAIDSTGNVQFTIRNGESAKLNYINENKTEDIVSSAGVKHIWKGTQAQYDAITTKDSSTLYIIV